AARLRELPREPRPGGQHGARSPPPCADEPGPIPRAAGGDAARPRDTDAVPGPGVRLLRSVPLLRRPRGRPRGDREARTARFPGPVPQPGPRGVGRFTGRARGDGDVPPLPARPPRTRAARADVDAAPRSPALATRRR